LLRIFEIRVKHGSSVGGIVSLMRTFVVLAFLIVGLDTTAMDGRYSGDAWATVTHVVDVLPSELQRAFRSASRSL
jgi:hypothetical protein